MSERSVNNGPDGGLGRLTYIPNDESDYGVGLLHTSRFDSSGRTFGVIQEFQLVSPPSWEACNAEIRDHCETRSQTPPLLLSEESASEGESQNVLQYNSCLAIGQIPHVRNASKITGVPVMAFSAGERGEILRVMKLRESHCHRDSHDNVHLNLLDYEPPDMEDEGLWSTDPAPITQIKFVLHHGLGQRIGWLLIQKRTCTMILYSEYHSTPTAQQSLSSGQRHSRISINPILTIPLSRTGGNIHSDVSFNPRIDDQPSQIAVVDERGFWYVWNISGRNGESPSPLTLASRGHFRQGILSNPGDVFRDDSNGHYGLAWIGDQDSWPQALLIWNQWAIKAVDIEGSANLSTAAIESQIQEDDTIKDVQLHPSHPNQVFLLTDGKLLWLDFGGVDEDGERQPTILSCVHLRASEDKTLHVSMPADLDLHAPPGHHALVAVYSRHANDFTAYWFEISAESGVPNFTRNRATISDMENCGLLDGSNVGALVIAPAKLDVLQDRWLSGPGLDYLDGDVIFHQVFVYRRDRSLGYWIGASSEDRDIHVLPPNLKPHTIDLQLKASQRRRRNAFVVPDEWSDNEDPAPQSTSYCTLDEFHNDVLEFFSPISEGSKGNASEDVFRSIRWTLKRNRQIGSMPLRLLIECVPASALILGDDGIDDSSWTSRLDEVAGGELRRVSTNSITTHTSWNDGETGECLDKIMSDLASCWPAVSRSLAPRAMRRARKRLMSETARVSLLSLYGAAVLDRPTAESGPESLQTDDPHTAENSMTAIRELGHYAASIGTDSTLAKTPQSRVLSSWPEEIGTSPEGYGSLSAPGLAVDDPGSSLTSAWNSRFSSPVPMRRAFPLSQDMPLTMSQPAAGAFGQRKVAKKRKVGEIQ